MADNRRLRLNALGGAVTFGAQAAQRMLRLYPEFEPELTFYPTAEESFQAVLDGKADATCAPEQMSATGFHTGSQSKLASPESNAYVVAEATHTYHCGLLVKPGTPLDEVREVQGHTGSITQSRGWLVKNLPRATITIVDTSSFGAAKAVLASDGSIASVGTPEAAREFGLEMAARDIDNGSVANYFAFAARPIFTERPNCLIVAGRLGPDGSLTRLAAALDNAGYQLHTVYTQPSGDHLFEYDYVLRFRGSGALSAAQRALADFPSLRLAGAYDVKE